MAERKLGRGLDFLIKKPTPPELPDTPVDAETPVADATPTTSVDVASLMPNPYQPRRIFDIDELNKLIESIREHGVLQPITVRKTVRGFELIAGERRWRASQELGLESIPAVVREADDQKMLEWALIENLQREDLDPIEKAKAYRQLIREFSLTQEEAAKRLSVKRSTVANHLRLLDLPREIQELVSSKKISMGHARALLAAPTPEQRVDLAQRSARGDLTVRDVERLAGAEKKGAPAASASAAPSAAPALDPNLADVVNRLRTALGTKVAIQGTPKRGRLTIEYFATDTLNRILEAIESDANGRSAQAERSAGAE